MFRVLVVIAAAMLAGCVSVQQVQMDAASAEALKGKELALSERPLPDFWP